MMDSASQKQPSQVGTVSVPVELSFEKLENNYGKKRKNSAAFSFRRMVRSASDPNLYSGEPEKRGEKKNISKRTCTTRREYQLFPLRGKVDDWILALQTKKQFVSLVSERTYFSLTGKADDIPMLVYISREPHLVMPCGMLNDEQIVLSKNAPVINETSVSLSYCKEEIPVAKAVILHLEMDDKAVAGSGTVKVGNNTKEILLEYLANIPIKAKRDYTISIPFNVSYSPDDQWNYKATPAQMCQVKICIEPIGDEVTLSIFKLGGETIIQFSLKGNIVENGLNKSDPEDYAYLLETLPFVENNNISRFYNYAYVSNGYYRIIKHYVQKKKKIKGESKDKLFPCKIGNYCYFVLPQVSCGELGHLIKVNGLYFEQFKNKDYDIVPLLDFTLKEVKFCEIKLDWYKFPQTILLNSSQILKQVRRALLQIPLEQGKKFLIPLSPEDEGSTVIQGEVISHGENQGKNDVLIINQNTDIRLTANNEILIHGGETEDQIAAAILMDLKRDFVGMDHVVQQIYDAVIVPLTAFKKKQIAGKDFERGIILYGPPGNGKTKIADNLRSVLARYLKAESKYLTHKSFGATPEIAHKSIDDVRKDFSTDRAEKRNTLGVVFIDELDSLVMSNDPEEKASDTKQAFSISLQKLMSDGPQNMFYIATANKNIVQLYPPMVREGRFGIHICIDNPNQEQREAILRYAFETRGVDFAALDIRDLARRSGGKPASGLHALVSTIITKANLRVAKQGEKQGEKQGIQLTKNDVEVALVDPSTIEISYQRALNCISDKAKVDKLLDSEKIALQETLQAVNRVKGNMGKHTVVLVKADKNRTEPFCYRLLQSVKQSSNHKCEALEQFSHFDMIPAGSSTLKLFSAIKDLPIAKRTLIVVDHVDQMLQASQQGLMLLKPDALGRQWAKRGNNNNQSAAMVLTYSDDTLDVAGIKAEMALDRINKKIAMTSKVLSTDYENIIDKFKPTAEMRRHIKEKLVRNLRQDFDIGLFENLLNLYGQKDESGKYTWDIQAILDDIETDASEQVDGMFT